LLFRRVDENTCFLLYMNHIYSKINSRLQFLLQWTLNKLFYKFVDCGFFRLSAIVLAMLTKTVNHKREAKRILCIGSLASLHDISALIEKSNIHQYLYLKRFYFGYILKKYVDVSEMTADNYHISKLYEKPREKVFKQLSVLFPVLKRILQFDAIMTSNFGYTEQQEFIAVARKNGTPVVVLYKEGLGNRRTLTAMAKSYKHRVSQCDLFLCYNENIKNALLKHNVEGLNNNNVVVTGFPRLDLYTVQVPQESLKQLTFFSFIAEDKFSYIVDDDGVLSLIRKKNILFHEAVIRFAIEHPEYKVVIKTKMSERDLLYAEEIKENYLRDVGSPSNLLITNEGNAMDYIIQSHIVLGANSTVLIEALVADRVVVSLSFSEFFDDSSWDLFEGYEHLLTYISSYEELLGVINNKHRNLVYDKKALDPLFKNFIYSADAMASVRVEKAVSQLLH